MISSMHSSIRPNLNKYENIWPMKTLKQKAKDKCDNNRTVEEIEEVDYIAPRFFVMYQPIANLGPFLLILV